MDPRSSPVRSRRAAIARRELTPLSRYLLVETLVHHARLTDGGCACGWGPLGASYARHVVDEYEAAVRAAARS